jgi:hypothetical protein
MKCPRCDSFTVLKTRTTKYSRGLRSVGAESFYYECPAPHSGMEGPLQFQDEKLIAQNEATAQAAWLLVYGEALPPSRYDLKKSRR